MSRHSYKQERSARYELVTSIPNWMRLADMIAETIVWLILLGGFFSFGYVTSPAMRSLAYIGCTILGFWAIIGVFWGRWDGPHKSPARWFMAIFAFAIAWTGLQLIPLPSKFVTSISEVWRNLEASYKSAGLTFPQRIPLAHSPAKALNSWFQLIASASFFAGVTLLASRRSSSVRLILAVSIACLIEGFLGIYTYVFLSTHRAYGAVYNPNHHADMIILGMPLYLAGLAVWGRLSSRFQGSPFSGSNPLLFFFAAGLVALVGWFASMSRGAILVGGLGLAAWVALEIWCYYHEEGLSHSSGSGAKAAFGIGGTLLMITLAAFLLLESASLPSGVIHRGVSGPAVLEHGKGRLELWRATMEGFGHSPWTGLGLYGTEAALTQFSRLPTVKTPIWSHNDYVQVFAEIGIPAALMLLILAAFFAKSYYQEMRYRQAHFDWAERILQRAAGAGVVILLVHAITDFHLRIPLIGFLFLTVLALSMNQGPLLITSMRRRR